MNCLVTAGPTYESLDEVRRLTNFSTGKLGSGLADCLATRGHRVVLLRGYYATHPAENRAAEQITFTTTADLQDRLRTLSAQPFDALFHAAAVSDFGFGQVFTRSQTGALEPVQSGKFSTRQGSLFVELVPTPKIIAGLRAWYPKTRLVGWKFEVDGTQEEALAAGTDQLRRCGTDGCVVNGRAYGPGFGWLPKEGPRQHWPDADALCTHLADWLERGA